MQGQRQLLLFTFSKKNKIKAAANKLLSREDEWLQWDIRIENIFGSLFSVCTQQMHSNLSLNEVYNEQLSKWIQF